MGSNPDFRDLFCELNAADARYLIVGAYAVIYHTEPRYTKDIDIWVEPTVGNAARVHAALSRFGAPVDTLTVDDLTDPHLIYQVGIEPNRIDILMAVTGLEFEACYQSSVVSSYDGVPIRLLALDDLITAKRAAGRLQDQLDLQRLEEKKSG